MHAKSVGTRLTPCLPIFTVEATKLARFSFRHCSAYFNSAGNIDATLPHVISADKVKVSMCRSGTQINDPMNIGSIHHAPCEEAKDFWMV